MSVKSKLRVLLADDHLVVRMGLSSIIALEDDLTVVGEAANGDETVRLADALRPNVIVMDLMMPILDGAEATKRILQANPAARILILTTFGTSDELRRALDNGALSAIVKDSDHAELLTAIRSTATGTRHISPVIDRQLKSAEPEIELSPRQIEILGYVAKGLNNAEIAKTIGIGRDCVKAHLKTAFARLNVASRAEAVTIALNKHLLKI